MIQAEQYPQGLAIGQRATHAFLGHAQARNAHQQVQTPTTVHTLIVHQQGLLQAQHTYPGGGGASLPGPGPN